MEEERREGTGRKKRKQEAERKKERTKVGRRPK
jgi:hypothetical protein